MFKWFKKKKIRWGEDEYRKLSESANSALTPYISTKYGCLYNRIYDLQYPPPRNYFSWFQRKRGENAYFYLLHRIWNWGYPIDYNLFWEEIPLLEEEMGTDVKKCKKE